MSDTVRWLELTITCSVKLTDAINDYLIGVHEAGVEFGVDDHLLEHTLHAYLHRENPAADEVEAIVKQVNGYLVELADIFGVAAPRLESSLLADEDWSSNWKAHFRPFAVTPGLVIKPTWEQYMPAAGELVIEMDPGMAFGTGHHATTSLCLGFIRSALAEHRGPVLDVGTGTGILAMAAALFGAPGVTAIDNDPEAVTAALANVTHNQLQDRVEVEITPLEEVEGTFALVVANIIHDVLLAMKDDLTRLTAPGGNLVLSGILRETQADNIVRVYEQAGFVLAGRNEKDEWAALRLVRR
jgi:ribosomal protein L11 methyltransferase